MKTKKYLSIILVFAMFIALAAGCGTTTLKDDPDVLGDTPDEVQLDPDEVIVEDPESGDDADEAEETDTNTDAEDEIAADLLYIPETTGDGYNIPSPVASGKVTKSNNKVLLDYSNTADGYVMAKYSGTNGKVKVIITGPSDTKYTYNMRLDGEYDVFPLSDGNGNYKIGIYENISGTSYSTAFSHSFSASMKDEFGPFLRSNKYVSYTTNGNVVKKATDLTKNSVTVLEKVTAIYNYTVKNLKYDYDLAKSIKNGESAGYVPDLEAVLKSGKGICFDYAALMAAMLRSQGVPTQLVFGYAGDTYHAWINVYNEEEGGWVTASIYFNGSEWKLMDPTFASTSNSSAKVLAYIGDGANYKSYYIY